MSALAAPVRATATLALGVFVAVLSAHHWDDVRERTYPTQFADLDVLWQGALRIAHDSKPLYDDPGSIQAGIGALVYPPPLVEALIPLTPLGYPTGALVFMAIQAACVGATLWAIRVTDWRCWLLTAFSVPVVDSLAWGNPAILATAWLALLWRWKDDSKGALAYAIAVCVKLMLLPLVFWMAATQRLSLALRSSSIAAFVLLGGWAAIGFDGLGSYPALLAHDARNYAGEGGLVNGFLHQVGAPYALATGVAVVCSAALLVLAHAMRAADHASFSFTVVACMVLSPLAAPYYFSFLVVVIGARWHRLAWPWLLVPILWLPLGTIDIGVARSALCLALVAALLVAVARGANATTSAVPIGCTVRPQV